MSTSSGHYRAGDVYISGDANKWVHADPPSTWEVAGLPMLPEEYKVNWGAAYYPLEITSADGSKQIANFIKIKWSNNPVVCGKHAGSPSIYINYLHAIPQKQNHLICMESRSEQLHFSKPKTQLTKPRFWLM